MNFLTSNIISDFCQKNNIKIDAKTLSEFDFLCEFLLEFNAHTNLTAIRDNQGVAIKHFADSLTALIYNLIPQNANVIDIGCGAGFPGLPLAHVRRDIKMTFLDSTAKKLNFTKQACQKLDITASFIPGRAEEYAFNPNYREKYDVAVSRAVAALPILLELSIPFIKPGGKFIAYKATGAAEELEAAKKAIPALGAKYVATFETELPQSSDGEVLHHSLMVFKKIKPTNEQYPRRYAQMLKKPL